MPTTKPPRSRDEVDTERARIQEFSRQFWERKIAERLAHATGPDQVSAAIDHAVELGRSLEAGDRAHELTRDSQRKADAGLARRHAKSDRELAMFERVKAERGRTDNQAARLLLANRMKKTWHTLTEGERQRAIDALIRRVTRARKRSKKEGP